jgi:NAD(P)-dependent dehydrogenase (short-subunit alcohol dehydrogenase family)
MMGLLEGKSALVTGGTSGIGRAVAIGLAQQGARIALCGRRAEAGEAVVSEIEQAGGEAMFVRTDVSRAAEVEALVEATVARFGRLDIAFNNAGIFEGYGLLADLTEEQYEHMFDANVRSTFLCLKHEIARMLAQGGGGSIINNASVQSHLALGWSGHYTACKHAILGYTRAAAVDYAKDNIRVNAISPGIVLTPMMSGFDPEAPESAERMIRIPAGRVATPDELIGAVVFLASDMASYVHGASIAIDGAWMAH